MSLDRVWKEMGLPVLESVQEGFWLGLAQAVCVGRVCGGTVPAADSEHCRQCLEGIRHQVVTCKHYYLTMNCYLLLSRYIIMILV